eukprot:gene17323-17516_t
MFDYAQYRENPFHSDFISAERIVCAIPKQYILTCHGRPEAGASRSAIMARLVLQTSMRPSSQSSRADADAAPCSLFRPVICCG